MYLINLDIKTRCVIIEISGLMQIEEVQAYINDLTNAVSEFEDKELSMLVLAQRMDPLPQECVEIYKEVTKLTLSKFKKVAEVHSRFVTQMQMRRIEEEVRREYKIDGAIMRFKSKKNALLYLYS